MTKNEYLAELRSRLHKLPEDDLNATIDFYTEYFEDATSETDAITTLGSPARLAAQLVADFSAQCLNEKSVSPFMLASEAQKATHDYQHEMPSANFPSYTDSNLENMPEQEKPTQVPDNAYTKSSSYAKAGNGKQNAMPQLPNSPYTTASGRKNSFSAIWYVILGICSLPIALPLVALTIGIIVFILALIIALVFVAFAVIAALIAGAIAAVSLSLSGAGSVSVGVAFVSFGLALILIPLMIMLTVWLVRAFGRLCAKIFNRLKERQKNNEN